MAGEGWWHIPEDAARAGPGGGTGGPCGDAHAGQSATRDDTRRSTATGVGQVRRRGSHEGSVSGAAWHSLGGDLVAAHSLWRPATAEESGLHADGGADAGAGDRFDYGDLQRRVCDAV